jgi:hypothetical protein
MCSDRRRHVRARAQSAVRCINTIVFQDADRSFVEDRLCEVAPAVPEATKEQVAAVVRRKRRSFSRRSAVDTPPGVAARSRLELSVELVP